LTLLARLRRLLGRRAVICPACGAAAGARISRSVETVQFHEQIGGGEAGGAVRPLIRYLDKYRCAACNHAWTRHSSEF
jgi:hypothetical protein